MRYRIVLIRRTGLRAAYIRWLTISEWDHIGLIDSTGFVCDMSESGAGKYLIKDRPDWRFKVLDIYAKNSTALAFQPWHKFSAILNLAWIFGLVGIRPVFFSRLPALHVNNVKLVADCFLRPDWIYLPPGAFERAGTYQEAK